MKYVDFWETGLPILQTEIPKRETGRPIMKTRLPIQKSSPVAYTTEEIF